MIVPAWTNRKDYIDMENKRFYFTYGSGDAHPFKGGWTVIEAPDRHAACALFRIYHPDRDHEGCINCSDIYNEEDFKKTDMYAKGNNWGAACQEIISVKRILKGV